MQKVGAICGPWQEVPKVNVGLLVAQMAANVTEFVRFSKLKDQDQE